MNILIFNWRDLKHSWAGGGEIYVFEQAVRWVKMGHEVTVFCGQDIDKKLSPFEIIDGIRIYRRGGRYSLYIWAIWYYLKQFRGKFDVVIDVENGIPFFTPLFCRIPKICLVHHIHDRQFFYELSFPLNYVGFLTEKYIFPLVYKNIPIITVSIATKERLIKLGFNKNKINVIYNGINDKKKKAETIRKFSNPTILYLGRIKRYKRVDMIVNIFPEIVKKIPQAHLIIAGWGTEAARLADLIMMSPFRKKINLVGPVSEEEKNNLLSRSWVFVNPSIGEGWSIAVIEANLHGTPAVSFNVSGLAESIQNGKTGLLAKDEEDLIDKICSLLNNKTLCDKLGTNAQERARKFDWDKTASESIKIIEKLNKINQLN